MNLAVKCAAEARRNHLCAFVSGYLATPYEASYAVSKLYEFFLAKSLNNSWPLNTANVVLSLAVRV